MTDDPTPASLAQGLIDLLDIEEIDTDLYRGARQPGGTGRARPRAQPGAGVRRRRAARGQRRAGRIDPVAGVT